MIMFSYIDCSTHALLLGNSHRCIGENSPLEESRTVVAVECRDRETRSCRSNRHLQRCSKDSRGTQGTLL